MLPAGAAVWHSCEMISRRTLLPTPLAALAMPAWGQDAFAGFVSSVKAEARRAGIREATLQQAFAGVAPNQRVIELDRRQPEFSLTWPEYRARVLPDSRLQAARENYARERALLARVEERYGVDPLIIMGIWGVESAFGANKGSYRLVEALSTLAWEGRRAAYFRGELINALRILDQEDMAPARMTGGWAGAMGQPQFMPSSYLRFAVDFDGDGRRDIWDSKPDVFGSVGNYLAKNGWRRGEPWAQPVRLPAGFDPAVAVRDNRRSLDDWMRAGVRRVDGRELGRADLQGAVVVPSGAGPGEGFMTYPNFNVIRRYNPSDFYALAVGLLGQSAA